MQGGKRTGGGHFEDRSVEVCAAPFRCPVEVSIAGLDHSCGTGAIRGIEPVQGGHCACGSHFEDRATARAAVAAGRPARGGRPVDVSIAGLNKRCRIGAVR